MEENGARKKKLKQHQLEGGLGESRVKKGSASRLQMAQNNIGGKNKII